MRQAVIQVTCDLCKTVHNEDERAVANAVITIDGQRPVEVDICDDCASQESFVVMLERAREVIVPKVRKPRRKQDASLHPKAGYQPPDPDRTIPCPVKGCDFMGKSNQSLATHTARTHKEQS